MSLFFQYIINALASFILTQYNVILQGIVSIVHLILSKVSINDSQELHRDIRNPSVKFFTVVKMCPF